jgi:hypothetical protein
MVAEDTLKIQSDSVRLFTGGMKTGSLGVIRRRASSMLLRIHFHFLSQLHFFPYSSRSKTSLR